MNKEVYEHLAERFAETGLPGAVGAGLIRYILGRVETGSFLRAVLENDLSEAVMRMAPYDGEGLRLLICFLYNHAPSPCWGSPEKVKGWLADPEPPQVGCD